MPPYIPRLRRAVSEYFLQPPSRETVAQLHVFEEYLEEPSSVDTVYAYFILQASKDLQCADKATKAVRLLRRYLMRHKPSQEGVQSIMQFCARAGEVVGPSNQEILQSLRYLRCLVTSLCTSSPGVVHGSMEDITSGFVKTSGIWKTISGETSELSGSLASGLLGGSHAGGRNSQQFVPSSNAGSSCGSDTAVMRMNPSVAGPLQQASESSQKGYGMSNGSPLLGAEWSMGPNHGLQGGLSSMLPMEMLRFRPPLVWMEGYDDEGLTNDADGWLAVTGIQGVSCPEHLWAVAGKQKLQSQDELQKSASIAGGGSLFQYKHYVDQDPLSLNVDELSAVLECVCGPGSSGTVEGPIWSAEEDDIWQPLEAPLRCVGQVCSNVFIKLVMDLWLRIGPAASYPLVLQMFQQTLQESAPAHRARAFDVVYNLAIHAQMMRDDVNEADNEEDMWEQGTSDCRWDHGTSASCSPSPSCLTPKSDRAPSSHRLHPLQEEPNTNSVRSSRPQICRIDSEEDSSSEMEWWLRSLLFDILILMSQNAEASEVVWSAALGSFLQLTTFRGQFLLSKIDRLPICVLSTMLRKCVQFGWSDELYAHLLRLPVHLLYLPDMQQAGGTKLAFSIQRFLQFGGVPEVLFHLQNCKSSEASGGLIKVLVDYAATQAGCRSDILAPLVSGLLSPGSLEVVLTAIRHGQKGVQEIVDRAVQNCILEHNAERGSPHKPSHHRNFYSQSSMYSIDTHSSSGSLMEPESFDSWKAVLCVVDANSCVSPVDSDKLTACIKETMAALTHEQQNVNYQTGPWSYLRNLLESNCLAEKKQGLNWLCELMTAQRNLLHSHGVTSRKSILPHPPPSYWDAPDEKSDPILSVLCNWLKNAEAREASGENVTLLIEQLFSHLFSVQTHPVNITDDKGEGKGKRESVVLQGQTLFETLGVALKWMDLMPVEQRRQPLLSISDCIFKSVHAPLQMAQTFAGTPSALQHAFRPFAHSSGSANCVAPGPGPFLYLDFLFGAGAVYVRLLRLVSTSLLVSLIDELDDISPAYKLMAHMPQVGFHGRPGYRNYGRSSHSNAPWSDTASDTRAALALLLLHRLTIDAKGEDQLKNMIKSLLKDSDVRIQYFASRYLLKQLMHEKPAECRRALQQFVAQAQQINDERIVDNPYLQVNHIMDIHIIE